MIRVILIFSVCILFGRWLYQETEIVAPELTPRIDDTLDYLEFPTHQELAELAQDPRWKDDSKGQRHISDDLRELMHSF